MAGSQAHYLVPRAMRWLKKVCAYGALAAICIFMMGWFTFSAKVFEYRAACATGKFDSLRYVDGELTNRFWAELQSYIHDEERGAYRKDYFSFRNGKAYVALIKFFPMGEYYSRTDGQFEERSYLVSKILAYDLYDSFREEGRISDEALSNFMTTVNMGTRRSGKSVLITPDQCEFMEELVLKGGRFAGD